MARVASAGNENSLAIVYLLHDSLLLFNVKHENIRLESEND
jgi:hypothetical protein